jgi:hypothetical protein
MCTQVESSGEGFLHFLKDFWILDFIIIIIFFFEFLVTILFKN